MSRTKLTLTEAAAAFKVFSHLCDEQRPLTPAIVRAELDRILTVAGIGQIRVAVGQTASNQRREAMLHQWGRGPLYSERAARWARCEHAARLLGPPQTAEPLGCGGSPGELTRAYVRAFENRGQTDTQTAGLLQHAGVHEINLGADVIVPVLPRPHTRRKDQAVER
jgi:hypothetical protein